MASAGIGEPPSHSPVLLLFLLLLFLLLLFLLLLFLLLLFLLLLFLLLLFLLKTLGSYLSVLMMLIAYW